jgi:hypothetical protein
VAVVAVASGERRHTRDHVEAKNDLATFLHKRTVVRARVTKHERCASGRVDGRNDDVVGRRVAQKLGSAAVVVVDIHDHAVRREVSSGCVSQHAIRVRLDLPSGRVRVKPNVVSDTPSRVGGGVIAMGELINARLENSRTKHPFQQAHSLWHITRINGM